MNRVVVWLDPHGMWDQTLLEDLFEFELWAPPRTEPVTKMLATEDADLAALGIVHDMEHGVLVIPGRYYVDRVAELRDAVETWDRVTVVVTSDEESLFPLGELLDWPNLHALAVMTPRHENEPSPALWLGEGYTPHVRKYMTEHGLHTERPFDWVFYGQITHSRREAMADALADHMHNAEWLATPGFTQGLDPERYAQGLANAKVAPCPSGPATQDSFRLYEALEAGCVPIADDMTPDGRTGYWRFLLADNPPPFPIITDWSEAPEIVANIVQCWPFEANRAGAWWCQEKRRLATRLNAVGSIPPYTLDDMVSVVIPTSPSRLHPSTEQLEITVASVRRHFPRAEVHIMVDGVHPEQAHLTQAYWEYTQRVVALCQHRWRNVVPWVHTEHLHQAEMTRRVLAEVVTPQVLFVEHDTPLVVDEPIDWWYLCALVDGSLNLVRLYHEAQVPEAHEHLMVGGPLQMGAGYIQPTMQWSQRPHLARTDWYQALLAEFFGADARTMIEDVMHGVVDYAWRTQGALAWSEVWKLGIYAPPGDNWKRSLHLDGRAGDPKLDMLYAYDGPTPPGAPAPTAGRVD